MEYNRGRGAQRGGGRGWRGQGQGDFRGSGNRGESWRGADRSYGSMGNRLGGPMGDRLGGPTGDRLGGFMRDRSGGPMMDEAASRYPIPNAMFPPDRPYGQERFGNPLPEPYLTSVNIPSLMSGCNSYVDRGFNQTFDHNSAYNNRYENQNFSNPNNEGRGARGRANRPIQSLSQRGGRGSHFQPKHYTSEMHQVPNVTPKFGRNTQFNAADNDLLYSQPNYDTPQSVHIRGQNQFPGENTNSLQTHLSDENPLTGKPKRNRKKNQNPRNGRNHEENSPYASNRGQGFHNQYPMQPKNPLLANSNNSIYSNPEECRGLGFHSQSQVQPKNPLLRHSNNTIYSNPEEHNYMSSSDNRPLSRSSFCSSDNNKNFSGNPNSDSFSEVRTERNQMLNITGKGTRRGSSNKVNKKKFTQKNELVKNESEDKNVFATQKGALTEQHLQNLAEKEPADIVHILSQNNDHSEIFQEILDPKMFLLAVKVLCKVCAADPSSERIEILRQASLPAFLNQLYEFISELPYTKESDIKQYMESFIENVITLYNTFSDFMPSASRIWINHLRQVEKSIKAIVKNLNVQLDPNLLVMVKSLLDDVSNNTDNETRGETVQRSVEKKETYFPEPVGDFRSVSLYPRPEDVFAEQPFLFPNIIKGPFRSIEQYLDVHFKLLREDFMSPIRQAIKDYKKQLNTKDKFKRIDNVRIYRKVKFLHQKTITDKVGYEICFDVDKKINRVNWEFSNRFMFGSLLLFTNDHFDTFFLATVANRNVKELEKKLLTVELKETSQNIKSVLGKEFIMAESEAYFEPYFHVLKALQMFDRTNFPLARYIVSVHTETGSPEYLSPEDIYNITMANNRFTFRVLSDLEWPTHDDLDLDPSQHEAFKAALTNDIVVIQGPPGTGKTFLGLKIAQGLLQNAHIWNRTNTPILVVCFTNHALDQFLEGLLPFTSKLVRIGGKSKGSELDKFNIRERRREFSYYKKTQTRETRELQRNMSVVFAEIQIYQSNLQLLDDKDGVLSLKTLQLVMSDNQREFFTDDDHLMDWLLVGVGKAQTEKKVKVTITAERGVVKETTVVDPLIIDAEDHRVKQALFDALDFDRSVPPPEDTVKVSFACNLNSINSKRNEIEEQLQISERRRNRYQMMNLKCTFDNLGLILTYLRRELLEFKQYPRSEFEKQALLDETFLNGLQSSDRWKLYNTWVDILRNGLMVELGTKEAQFKDLAFRFEQMRQSDDIQILKTSHVVGTTTTLAAKLQPVFTAIAPKIVIVEEAAEVLEAHIMASLTKSCEHLILIGDHKQLRPSVAETRLARQYLLDVSLFERMVNNGLACHTLTLQHRMRPEISKQLVPTIYPTLLDHDSVQDRDRIKGMDKNVFFMTHNHFEDDVVEVTSKRNHFEAMTVLKLAKYLLLQGYKPEEITILATYKGQMFHMKNEIKNIDGFPRNLQITVVDNFQGEENKIILLSLVRSNALNKIGFLEVENRVCVALSRARDGLYIVGNMANLVASSEIWPQIKKSLMEQHAFGSALPLRCEVHNDQVTMISCEKDWSKVSEGGCSQLCGQTLSCGHACKSMCHISQDYHLRYKCKEPCPRILCQDGHQCPKKCHMVCGDCQIPMRRPLACGHFADVPCYMDTRQYLCQEPVEVQVVSCGHSVTVPCHSQTDPKCNMPCIIRLECGHSCDKVCHVNDDPDHLDYACLKPCPRLNRDCSEDHKCNLACFEDCLPCMAVVQKLLPCDHTVKIMCSIDMLTVQCKRKCERTMACGHPCAKKCWEQCEPCPVIVEKTVSKCGHNVNVACSIPPTIRVCEGPCSTQLTCGHTCAKRCRDTCSSDDCTEPKRFRITTLLCGHTDASLPCNKAAFIRDMTGEELMQYCSKPCGQMLTCQHPCSGSCSECMQGRIHKVCDQPCGNVLICGHSCRVPCREVCPPCNQPCSYRCKHSKCAKKCGEVCVPCHEPCDYACPHLQCKKHCGELCDRKPCYDACPKLLDCTHPCVGFCGEPCPPCRQCEPHHFEEFFYTGEETEENAKWIYLEDCKHTFETSGLEYWLNMKQEGSEIVSKACPRCKTPIVKVQRFMNLVKETYRDIQKVKSQVYGKLDDLKKQRLQCLRKLQNINLIEMNVPGNEPDALEGLYKKLVRELPEVKKKKRNVIDSQKVRLLCFLTEFFVALYERKQDAWEKLDDEARVVVVKRMNFLTQLLRKRERKISEQEMKSFELELKRIIRLCDLLTYTSSTEYHMASSYSGAKETRKKAEEIINSVSIYNDELDNKMKTLLADLKKLIKSSTEISNAEKAMINEAMKGSFHSSQKTGHWFKCRKGHVYCITECGGAMQEALCPERGCGEKIGGQNHALRGDQSLASEMDGARYAAYSDQNNMANFGFN